jgi:predicted nucleic-acid-binding protein
MIGLDTNILVRFMAKDDPVQSPIAARLINRGSDSGDPFFVNHVVLCELVWVMESCYGMDRQWIEDIIERVLETVDFLVEDKDSALEALREYKRGGLDYSDCLIGRKNLRLGCEATLTFDGKASKLPGFRLLEAPPTTT